MAISVAAYISSTRDELRMLIYENEVIKVEVIQFDHIQHAIT